MKIYLKAVDDARTSIMRMLESSGAELRMTENGTQVHFEVVTKNDRIRIELDTYDHQPFEGFAIKDPEMFILEQAESKIYQLNFIEDRFEMHLTGGAAYSAPKGRSHGYAGKLHDEVFSIEKSRFMEWWRRQVNLAQVGDIHYGALFEESSGMKIAKASCGNILTHFLVPVNKHKKNESIRMGIPPQDVMRLLAFKGNGYITALENGGWKSGAYAWTPNMLGTIIPKTNTWELIEQHAPLAKASIDMNALAVVLETGNDCNILVDYGSILMRLEFGGDVNLIQTMLQESEAPFNMTIKNRLLRSALETMGNAPRVVIALYAHAMPIHLCASNEPMNSTLIAAQYMPK